MGPTSISPCLTFFTFQIISCKLHLRHSNRHLRWLESLRLAGGYKVSGICPSIRDHHSVLVTIWCVCSLNLRLDVNPDYFALCVAMIHVCVIFKCRSLYTFALHTTCKTPGHLYALLITSNDIKRSRSFILVWIFLRVKRNNYCSELFMMTVIF